MSIGRTVDDKLLLALQSKARKVGKAGHSFDRLVVTEAEAMSLFPDNPFKQHFIRRALRVMLRLLITCLDLIMILMPENIDRLPRMEC